MLFKSWRLQHNIRILQTCKTVIVEMTPILYRRNTFPPDPQLSQAGRRRVPYTKGLADAEIVKKRAVLYLAWRPHLKSLCTIFDGAPNMTDRALQHALLGPLLQPPNNHTLSPMCLLWPILCERYSRRTQRRGRPKHAPRKCQPVTDRQSRVLRGQDACE
jgi:hypothetical protein